MTDPELYDRCPYNKSHIILKSRMQYHVVKCKRNLQKQQPKTANQPKPTYGVVLPPPRENWDESHNTTRGTFRQRSYQQDQRSISQHEQRPINQREQRPSQQQWNQQEHTGQQHWRQQEQHTGQQQWRSQEQRPMGQQQWGKQHWHQRDDRPMGQQQWHQREERPVGQQQWRPEERRSTGQRQWRPGSQEQCTTDRQQWCEQGRRPTNEPELHFQTRASSSGLRQFKSFEAQNAPRSLPSVAVVRPSVACQSVSVAPREAPASCFGRALGDGCFKTSNTDVDAFKPRPYAKGGKNE